MFVDGKPDPAMFFSMQGRILAHLLDACLYIPLPAIQRTLADGILIDEASRRLYDFVVHDSTALIF